MAVRSMVYVVVFSLGLLILDRVDLSAIAYSTSNGTSRIMGPLAAGIIMGYVYSILMKASAYTGGTDFLAAIIHAKNPEKSVMGLTFLMNATVAIASYFVYDYKVEPVLLCILYSFASTNMAERFLCGLRSSPTTRSRSAGRSSRSSTTRPPSSPPRACTTAGKWTSSCAW